MLDLKDASDRAVADDLIAGADVLVSTWRPRTAARLGLGPAALERLNPRLVSASITGWGQSGPWADLKGYEGLVMAKLGTFHAKEAMVARPGPAFVSVPTPAGALRRRHCTEFLRLCSTVSPRAGARTFRPIWSGVSPRSTPGPGTRKW